MQHAASPDACRRYGIFKYVELDLCQSTFVLSGGSCPGAVRTVEVISGIHVVSSC